MATPLSTAWDAGGAAASLDQFQPLPTSLQRPSPPTPPPAPQALQQQPPPHPHPMFMWGGNQGGGNVSHALEEMNNLLANSEQYIVKNISDLVRNAQYQISKSVRDAQPPPASNKLTIAILVIVCLCLLLLMILFLWLRSRILQLSQSFSSLAM